MRKFSYFFGVIRKNRILFPSLVISKVKGADFSHFDGETALWRTSKISWKIAGPFSLFRSTRISRYFFCIYKNKICYKYSIFFEKLELFLIELYEFSYKFEHFLSLDSFFWRKVIAIPFRRNDSDTLSHFYILNLPVRRYIGIH